MEAATHRSARSELDPCSIHRSHLQSTEVVLRQQRQQAVVGVFADTPRAGAVGARRAVEDAEQYGRVAGEVPLEPVGRQPEPQRQPAHDPISDRSQGIEPVENGGAQVVRPGRKVLGSVQGSGVEHPGMVGRMLDPEVDPLLVIGNPRCQFTTHRKPAAPGCSGPGHRDLGFGGVALREEPVGGGFEAFRWFVDTPWPTMEKKPTLRQAASMWAAVSASDASVVFESSSGATWITGNEGDECGVGLTTW